MRVKVKLISGEFKIVNVTKMTVDVVAKALGLSRKHIVSIWREY